MAFFLGTQMQAFAALVFCLALPAFLLSHVAMALADFPPLGGEAITPPPVEEATAPSGTQAITPPAVEEATAPSGTQAITPPPVEEATAPSGSQAVTPPPMEEVVTPRSGGKPVASPEAPAAMSPSGPQVFPPSGTIKRLTKQHILATIPPNAAAADSQQPFIASPSGNYVGYLLRRETAPGAGGFGNDFCYLQVRDTRTGASVWGSDCAPTSTANACSLVFTDAGLEVFDGSRSSWDAGVDAEHLETLEMVDEGDMRIRTRDGDLAWRASDDPRANQRCGALGSPGQASARPPFAASVEDSRNLPFGQPSVGGQQQPAGTLFNQRQPLSGFVQPAGDHSSQQPLVDNTPFDSAGARVYQRWLAVALALLLTLVAYGFLI